MGERGGGKAGPSDGQGSGQEGTGDGSPCASAAAAGGERASLAPSSSPPLPPSPPSVVAADAAPVPRPTGPVTGGLYKEQPPERPCPLPTEFNAVQRERVLEPGILESPGAPPQHTLRPRPLGAF